MTLCSSGHEEVCYEGINCPACEALEDVKDLYEELRSLYDVIRKLESEQGETT